MLGMYGLSPLPRLSAYGGSLVQRVLIEAQMSTNPQSIWSGANPPVIESDFAVHDRFTQQGNVVTVSAEGIASIQTGGSSARQSFNVAHYSRQLLDFTADRIQYVNNSAPSGSPQNLVMTVGVPFGPLDMATFFVNTENDPLTITVSLGAPPNGLTINGSTIQGTPILAGTGSFTLTASDGIDTGACVVNWTVGPSSAALTAGSLLSEVHAKSLVGGALVG